MKTNNQIELLKSKQAIIEERLRKEQEQLNHIPTETTLKWFEFLQNNSGGSFDCNDKVCHRLLIQAKDYTEARQKALDLGVYFNGCADGYDCSCCGDRWNDWNEDELNYEDEHTVSEWADQNQNNAITKWNQKYQQFTIIKQPETNTRFGSQEAEGTIKTNTIEEYAQYASNNHGWTTPDTRIFYANGTTKEIFTQGTTK